IDGVQSVAVSAGGPDLALAIAYGNTGIVVAGAAWSTALGGNFDFALARLAGDGALDTGFGTGGTVQINWDMGGNHNDVAWAIGVWPDGEIVAASDVASGADSWMWMLHRYSASGTYLDGIFGTYCGGLAPPCSPAPQDSPRAMLLQGDGKLLVAGFGLGAAGDSDFGLMRRNRDLSPDNLFGGGDGQLTLDFALGGGAHRDHAMAMAFDRDGRIVVAGSAEWSGLDTDFAWARFDSSYIFADGFDWPGGSSRWSATVP
ncbi:MAG: hypothetical protein K8H90_09090, partial [Thermoanaerobaculia bacterium]|nr:hypothetical protein [Thermoanaerobaculia bacterium]